MVILVTGGAGFVGSQIVDRLVAAGHEVRVVDLLHRDAHATAPDYLAARAEYRFADLRDPEVAVHAVRGVDAVCHQASMVGLGVDFADVTEYVGHNDLATAVLLRALHDDGFTGRFVLASSMVVYGEGRYRCARHGIVVPPPRAPTRIAAGEFEPQCPWCDAPLTAEAVPEDAPLDPRNVYAATKLHQEQLCAVFGREHGVPVTALRYHNVYGPRMPAQTPYAGVASLFRSALERGEAPCVLEDGLQTRDFVHVADVARANVLALVRDEPYAGPLNVASGAPCTVGEMARLLASAYPGGRVPEVVGGARPGDVRHVFAAPERADAAIGFRAAIPPHVGIPAFARDPLRVAVGAADVGRVG